MLFQSTSHVVNCSNEGTPVHKPVQKNFAFFLLVVVALTEGSAWQMAKGVFGDYAALSTLVWRQDD